MSSDRRARRDVRSGTPARGVHWPATLRTRHLGRELSAGLTLLAISVPLNIGYAQVAGLPPTAGLYALVLPTVVYALAASSRQVVAAPDAAAAALVFSSLVGLQGPGVDLATLAAAQALVGGVVLLAAGVLRLGFLATFLSRPILVGFVAGLALEIMVSQVAKMLGLKLPSGSEFLESCAHLVTHVGTANVWSVLLAAGTLLVLLGGRRVAPAVPWAMVALVVATVVTSVAGLDRRGVAVLGQVPSGLPGLSWPRLDAAIWVAVLPSAAALSMITMAEGLLIGRSYASRNRYEVRPNRDLVAFGLGNLVAGLSSAFTMGSSTSRTAAMDDARSRSQLPSLVLAAGAAAILLFGTGLVASIPSPAIGAMVAAAVVKLLGVGELRRVYRASRSEFVIAMCCLVTVLLAGPLTGLLLAFLMSVLNIVRRAAHPPLDVLAGEEFARQGRRASGRPRQQPPVVVVRMAAPLFFANAPTLADTVQDEVTKRHARGVVLDLEAVTDIDVTSREVLEDLLDWLAERDVRLVYSRVRPDLLPLLPEPPLPGGVALHRTNRAAVRALAAELSTSFVPLSASPDEGPARSASQDGSGSSGGSDHRPSSTSGRGR